MEPFLRLFLPAYFIVYFGIAFVAKSIITAKKIGKSPLVLPKDDTVYGLVGFYFKINLVGIFSYVFVFAFKPTVYPLLAPIQSLESIAAKYIGFVFLGFALIWTTIAQIQMKDSWRIGIDVDTKTKLIITGLFGLSRNPIFLGMIASLLGVFLITPNALTFLFLVLGYVLIQIQIRLEEDFLNLQHKQEYLNYKSKVRRLL